MKKQATEGGWFESDEQGIGVSLYRKDVSTMGYVRITWADILKAAKKQGKL